MGPAQADKLAAKTGRGSTEDLGLRRWVVCPEWCNSALIGWLGACASSLLHCQPPRQQQQNLRADDQKRRSAEVLGINWWSEFALPTSPSLQVWLQASWDVSIGLSANAGPQAHARPLNRPNGETAVWLGHPWAWSGPCHQAVWLSEASAQTQLTASETRSPFVDGPIVGGSLSPEPATFFRPQPSGFSIHDQPVCPGQKTRPSGGFPGLPSPSISTSPLAY